MSEAIHHTPESPGEKIAPILSIHSKKEQPELQDRAYRQRIAYEQAADVCMNDLTDAVHSSLNGVQLAEAIDTCLSPPRGDDNPTRLQAALLELSRLEKEGSHDAYDDYDDKVENDSIFKLLVDNLSVSKTSTRETRENSHENARRRHAARKLLDLRLYSPDHDTMNDDAWGNVISRLFN